MAKPQALSAGEIATKLEELPGWRFEDGGIVREYQTDGWPTTLLLVNAIGFFAEAADHHPDLAVSWGKVVVKLWTHSAGGVTASDVALAREIERIALWRPPAGGELRGTTRKFVQPGGGRSP
ncbi:MAG: 4a-hydroxytetrahydrobiopterin dehydratase [Gemmatimonadales bacterium]